MDSATHVVMGFGLAGLAALDPFISSDPVTAHAVMIGAVAGSVIPDIDTVLKFKNNASYIRNHRGITHSLPLTFCWPLLIAAFLQLLYPATNGGHLLVWTLVATCLHVFVDIFNAYGTQAVRPLNGKWLALGIINIFDPFIFGLHLAGLAVWALTGQPGITFAVIYVILTVYYVSRTVRHHKTVRLVKRSLPDVEKVFLSPTLRWANYHMAAESADHYYVGKIDGNRLRMINTFERRPIDSDHPAVKAALADKNVRAFRSFSPIYHWRALENSGGYMIQFIDLRYFARGTYPFTATVRLNKDLTIQSSYTGWVYSRKKLERKLVPAQTKI